MNCNSVTIIERADMCLKIVVVALPMLLIILSGCENVCDCSSSHVVESTTKFSGTYSGGGDTGTYKLTRSSNNKKDAPAKANGK